MRSKLSAITARTPSRAGAFRRPVARRTAAVVTAGDHDRRRRLGAIAFGSLKYGHCLATRLMPGKAAFAIQHKLQFVADIGKCAADHHLVVRAAAI